MNVTMTVEHEAAGAPGRGDTPAKATHRPYQPLDTEGRLLRERPDDGRAAWSRVPVGPAAAEHLFRPYIERERTLLRALEQRRYLTVEQIARCFYNSYDRAQKLVARLFALRFVARFERT